MAPLLASPRRLEQARHLFRRVYELLWAGLVLLVDVGNEGSGRYALALPSPAQGRPERGHFATDRGPAHLGPLHAPSLGLPPFDVMLAERALDVRDVGSARDPAGASLQLEAGEPLPDAVRGPDRVGVYLVDVRQSVGRENLSGCSNVSDLRGHIRHSKTCHRPRFLALRIALDPLVVDVAEPICSLPAGEKTGLEIPSRECARQPSERAWPIVDRSFDSD